MRFGGRSQRLGVECRRVRGVAGFLTKGVVVEGTGFEPILFKTFLFKTFLFKGLVRLEGRLGLERAFRIRFVEAHMGLGRLGFERIAISGPWM